MRNTTKLFIKWVLLALLAVSANAAATENSKKVDKNLPELKQMIAQKLILDLRYYCEPKAKAYCQTPVTQLNTNLQKLIKDTQVGGIILFAENLVDAEQILRLNHDMQMAALSSQSTPLYIAIDQEGGRVSRMPSELLFPFAGNMAIGASYHNQGTRFAQDVATLKAKTLKSLGFNLNFAPSLDVNSNPKNPIINVRSFSQSPEVVAQLGSTTIDAYQRLDIATAAKHFPGHGDTFVDSHVGLPRVEHSIEQISKLDLYPFKKAIEDADVDMIMTAHIQYPALDSTLFVAKDGTESELPATLSERILNDLLRKDLKFDGLIVSDALDMAAIGAFLSPQDAVLKAFAAGADIALMPFKISSKQDIAAFETFLDALTQKISTEQTLSQQVQDSYLRILAHKSKRDMLAFANLTLDQKQAKLEASFEHPYADSLAMRLSQASFTEIKPLDEALRLNKEAKVFAVMPDKRRCQALLHYLNKAQFTKVSCSSLLSQSVVLPSEADAVLVGAIDPQLSFFESREFEGISAQQRLNSAVQMRKLDTLLAQAKRTNTTRVLLNMRSPYVSAEQLQQYNAVYASYDYQVRGSGDTLFAPSFASFVGVLQGKLKVSGVAPVDIVLEE